MFPEVNIEAFIGDLVLKMQINWLSHWPIASVLSESLNLTKFPNQEI